MAGKYNNEPTEDRDSSEADEIIEKLKSGTFTEEELNEIQKALDQAFEEATS